MYLSTPMPLVLEERANHHVEMFAVRILLSDCLRVLCVCMFVDVNNIAFFTNIISIIGIIPPSS